MQADWVALILALVVCLISLVVSIVRGRQKPWQLPTPEMAGWRRCGSCRGLYPPMSSDAGMPDEFCCAECEIAALEEKYGKAA